MTHKKLTIVTYSHSRALKYSKKIS